MKPDILKSQHAVHMSSNRNMFWRNLIIFIIINVQMKHKHVCFIYGKQMYEQEHGKKMKTSAIAAMLSTMLYQRRFFPFYVHNIIAGLDDEGQ